MADLSNSSFIPKQGPVKKRRRSASKKVYVFSIISFVLVFATLIGAGAVYFYANIIDQQLKEAVKALNDDIATFSESDMQRVQDFDRRLTQVNDRFNNTASIVSILESLEEATIDTASINNLLLAREGDSNYVMTLNIDTDSFDATIFQRGIYNDNELVESILIQSLNSSGLSQTETDVDDAPAVDFIAEVTIPLSAIPYVPVSSIAESASEIPVEVPPTTETPSEVEEINQNQS